MDSRHADYALPAAARLGILPRGRQPHTCRLLTKLGPLIYLSLWA